jgi:hypothetical protein
MTRSSLPVRAQAILALVIPALALGLGRPARAVEYSFGVETVSGDFRGDESVRLSEAPLTVTFGNAMSHFSVRVPYTRIEGTGNVTLATGGPAVLGAGGPGRPAFQTSLAGETESGVGDVLLRHETYLLPPGQGKKTLVSFILDYKVATADKKKGLGTGKSDWGGGLSLVQPLGVRWQFLGDADFHFMGSPEGYDFKDRLHLAAGFAIVSNRVAFRARLENVSPVLDTVPVFDSSGAPAGMDPVRDRRFVRADLIWKLAAGGSTRIGLTRGVNGDSEDLGLSLIFSTGPQ